MRQNIYINEKSMRKSGKKLNLGVYIIISFLAVFFTLWILEGTNFTSAISYVFSKKNIVKYDSYTLSFDDTVIEGYQDLMKENLSKLVYEGTERFQISQGNADIVLSMQESEGSVSISSFNLVPVSHRYSLLERITTDNISNYNIYVLDPMYAIFLENEFGKSVEVVDTYEEIIENLQRDDGNIALLDISDIDFQVKVLELDEKYFLEGDGGGFEIGLYADISDDVTDFVLSVLERNIGGGDEVWDMESLVKVNMGGVVAMSRGLAMKMDSTGDYGYPAREIGEFLADADLTHVSNEVSFVPGCRSYSGMSFCSRPEYVETLQDSGVDIVELTGNHNNDYGSEYSKATIETYVDLGMRYFGGGLEKEDASKVLYEEVGDTTIAFVGYNYYDTMYGSLALAGDTRSGANSYSEAKVEEDVLEAREKADIVIVTFQFQECYSYPATDVIYPICYKPLSIPDQRGVFKQAIDVGADIVVGTQAHQPQTFELYKEGIIFYGLGNLFFDQDIWIGTRQGLVLSHYFYKGEHIQTKVTPILMGKDLIPRVAEEEDGDLLMELLKEARD